MQSGLFMAQWNIGSFISAACIMYIDVTKSEVCSRG